MATQKRSRLSKIYFAVRRLRYKGDDGTKLQDLSIIDEFPKDGAWTYSNYYAQIAAVLAHGFRPSEFGLCDPEDDLAVIVAYEDTTARMTTYVQKKAQKKT